MSQEHYGIKITNEPNRQLQLNQLKGDGHTLKKLSLPLSTNTKGQFNQAHLAKYLQANLAKQSLEVQEISALDDALVLEVGGADASKLKIQITATGDVSILDAGENISLNIDTQGEVNLDNAAKLTLFKVVNAKEVHFNKSIQADKIKIQTALNFVNFGKLQADVIDIEAKSLKNHGLLKATSSMAISVESEIDNHGIIHSQEYLDFTSTAKQVAKIRNHQGAIIKGEKTKLAHNAGFSFDNYGEFITEAQLTIDSGNQAAWINNYHLANILIHNLRYASAFRQLGDAIEPVGTCKIDNYAQFTITGKANTTNKQTLYLDALHNHEGAEFNYSKRASLSLENAFTNDGEFTCDSGEIHCDDFDISETGCLYAFNKDCKAQSKEISELIITTHGNNHIAGELGAGHSLKFSAEQLMHVTEDGRVFSGNRLLVDTPEHAVIDGFMGGKVKLKVNAKQGIITNDTAKVSSKGFTELNTYGTLKNSNVIEAGHFLSLNAMKFENKCSHSRAHSSTHAHIAVDLDITSYGDITAKADCDIAARKLTNASGGRAVARNQSIDAKVVINAGKNNTKIMHKIKLFRTLMQLSVHDAVKKLAAKAIDLFIKVKEGTELRENDNMLHHYIDDLLQLHDVILNHERDIELALTSDFTASFQALATDIVPIWKANELPEAQQYSDKTFAAMAKQVERLAGPAVMGAQQTMSITAEQYENAGILLSKEKLTLTAMEKLSNLASAFILSHGEANLRSQALLINAGHLVAKSQLTVNARQWITNLATGTLASENIDILTKNIDNHGILTANQMSTKIQGTFTNYVTGKINIQEALSILSGKFVNAGDVRCANKILIDAKQMIDNQQSGKIKAAEALVLLCGSLIKNHGSLMSQEIRLQAKTIQQDIMQAKIVSTRTLQLFARQCLRNAGLLCSSKISINPDAQIAWLDNLVEGRLIGDQITIQGQSMRNAGLVQTNQSSIDIHMQETFEQLSSGEIHAETAVKLTAADIKNRGIINAKKNILLEARQLLENSGQITAQGQLSLLCASIISNSGKLTAMQDIKLKAQSLYQSLTAKMISQTQLNCVIDFIIDNAGMISSQQGNVIIKAEHLKNAGHLTAEVGSLDVETKILCENVATGVITAAEALSIKSKTFINSGSVQAAKQLHCDISKTFKNLQLGNIRAGEALTILCAGIVANTGTIKAWGDIHVQAQHFLQKLTSGNVLTTKELKIITDFSFDVTGVLSGKNIKLKTTQKQGFINILESAKILGKEGVTLNTDTAKNTGLVESSQGTIDIRAKVLLENYAQGRIVAKDIINILSNKVINHGFINSCKKIHMDVTALLENHGVLESRDCLALMCASVIRNTGTIKSLGELTLQAQTLLQEVISGKIISQTKLDMIVDFAIKNAGVLVGKKTTVRSNTANLFIENLKTGSILGETQTSIVGKQLKNAGGVESAQGSVTLDIQTLCEQVKSGFITAAEAVSIKAQQLTHDGKTQAKGNIAVSVKDDMNVAKDSVIHSDKDIDIKAKSLTNNGFIQAAQNINADIETLLDNKNSLNAGLKLGLVCASIIKNTGTIEAWGDVTVTAHEILQDLLTSKIVSAEKLNIIAEQAIKNAGILAGKHVSMLTQLANGFVENFKDARILGKDNVTFDTKKARNAGDIVSEAGDIMVKNFVLFENLVDGTLTAREAIDFLGGKVINSGTIESAKKIHMDVQDVINHADATISAQTKLNLICASIVSNAGNIEGWQDVTITAQKILQRIATGKIISEQQLSLIVDFAIENAGVLSGAKTTITATAVDGWIKNLAGAKILGDESCSIEGKNISNGGDIQSKVGTITLKEHVVFENMASGVINAKEGLDILGEGSGVNHGKLLAKWGRLNFKGDFTHAGILETEGKLSIEVGAKIKLLRNSKISVKDTLNFVAGQKIYTQADVLAYQTLSLIAPLIEQKEGTVQSKLNDVLIEATDWLLQGHIKAAHNIVAKVANKWSRSKEATLEADDTVELTLSKGHTFIHPLKVKKHLTLNANRNANFHFKNDVSTGQGGDFRITGAATRVGGDGANFVSLASGGDFYYDGRDFDNERGGISSIAGMDILSDTDIHYGRAIKILRADHKGWQQDYFVSNGAYMVSGGSANLLSRQGNIFNEHAAILVKGNTSFDARNGITHNLAGLIDIGGNLTNKSTAFVSEQRYSQTTRGGYRIGRIHSDRASLSVQGDADFSQTAMLRNKGSAFNVARNFSHSSLTEENHEVYDKWTERHCRTEKKRFLGFKYRTVRHYYNVNKHHTEKVYSGQTNAGGKISCANPEAKVIRVGGYVGGGMDLQFQDFKLTHNLDNRQLPQQVNPINDLSAYHRVRSRLFMQNTAANADVMFDYAVPAWTNPIAIPAAKRVFQSQSGTAPVNSQIPFKYSPAMMASMVQDALSDLLNVGFIGDTYKKDDVLNLLIDNAAQYKQNLGVNNLTEAQITAADKPMLIFKTVDVQGKTCAEPYLIIPKHMHAKHFMEVMQDMILDGSDGSRVEISELLKVSGELSVTTDDFLIRERLAKEYRSARVSRKTRIEKAVDVKLAYTGAIEAHTINIMTKRYRQIGSELRSEAGGTNIIANTAEIIASRAEEIIESNCESTIKPVFNPASLSSQGDIRIMVGALQAMGVDISAAGNVELSYEHLVLKLLTEYYTLPTEKKKGLFSTKISGGIEVAKQGNTIKSGQGTKLHCCSKTGSTLLENTKTDPDIIIDAERDTILIRELNPQGQYFSYKKSTLFAQAVAIAASCFAAPALASMAFTTNSACFVVAKGAFAGAIRSGILGGNALKGTLQGGVMAGVNNFANGLSGLNGVAGQAVKTAMTSGANSLLTGGDFGKDFFQSIGGGLVDGLIGSAIPNMGQITANPSALQAFKQAAMKSLITNAFVATATKEKMSDVLNNAMLAGVGAAAVDLGNKVATKIEAAKVQNPILIPVAKKEDSERDENDKQTSQESGDSDSADNKIDKQTDNIEKKESEDTLKGTSHEKDAQAGIGKKNDEDKLNNQTRQSPNQSKPQSKLPQKEIEEQLKSHSPEELKKMAAALRLFGKGYNGLSKKVPGRIGKLARTLQGEGCNFIANVIEAKIAGKANPWQEAMKEVACSKIGDAALDYASTKIIPILGQIALVGDIASLIPDVPEEYIAKAEEQSQFFNDQAQSTNSSWDKIKYYMAAGEYAKDAHELRAGKQLKKGIEKFGKRAGDVSGDAVKKAGNVIKKVVESRGIGDAVYDTASSFFKPKPKANPACEALAYDTSDCLDSTFSK